MAAPLNQVCGRALDKAAKLGNLIASTGGAAQAANRTHSADEDRHGKSPRIRLRNISSTAMPPHQRVLAMAACAAILTVASAPADAQSGNAMPEGKAPPGQAAEAFKEEPRPVDEFAEAARMVHGPAGNPECVRLGRQVVGLMWREDMDAAFRHLDLYDRFGCPGPHIQAAFRCLIRRNTTDSNATQDLDARVHACWLNPAVSPPNAAAAAFPPVPTAKPAGTNGR